MVELFGFPGACSLAPHIALEESGIPFRYVMSRKGNAEEREALLKVNPVGQVPALRFDDGRVLTQNAAILGWVADQVPEKKLLPKAGTFERAKAEEWLSYLGTTLHPAFSPLFNPSLDAEARKAQKEKVRSILDVVESRFGDGPWVLGESFSAVDPYLYVFFSWTTPLQIDTAAWPKLRAHSALVREREAAKRAFKTEGLG